MRLTQPPAVINIKNECSVFVVDKDVHVRKLLTEFLSDSGYVLRFFDDGYAALDAARLNPPALIITEILVPKLDGLSLCRLVKGDYSMASVNVMVLSVLSGEVRAQQSRADRFLTKPIQRSTLLQSVRALTDACGDQIKT
ncbi:MAG TPA: response regulator [Pyrinomonadaceae bacterium]|nr:response regulator [Pyrinomonadaceae bacterium]